MCNNTISKEKKHIMSKMTDKKYLECGKIVNTHGIKGAVKIDPWCDSPETLAEIPCLFFENNGNFEKRKVVRSYSISNGK